jgi:hypothetical protein
MKSAAIGFAGLALAGMLALGSASAAAQGLPQGSYLQTCRDAHIERGSLVAVCRSVDGRWNPTGLPDPYRCNGRIDNINGVLRCEFAGGPPAGRGYGEPRYGGEFRERCEHWHHEADELRYRLDREGNPYERGQLEGRLHELRERLERCR